MGDGHAAHAANLLKQQQRIVHRHPGVDNIAILIALLRRHNARLVAADCLVVESVARHPSLQEERYDLAGAIGVEHVVVAYGVVDAALEAEETDVVPGQVIHIGHLLRVPPPVVVGSSLMVGRGAEVHAGRVDHVAVEVCQRAVDSTSGVPTQFRVSM